ncbi:hypothetical protein O1611_g8996 [Lasiodiplodia mahajangana]|uniref:Uncharacterized protein n=1 Tax=Lasiodiplodia mahajangana TaxID=1108764 RepID=A0ACC2JB84_9PEZI|nr:hypothetical protein O1611_g8996 [Lasiodiplodia mahajangana]
MAHAKAFWRNHSTRSVSKWLYRSLSSCRKGAPHISDGPIDEELLPGNRLRRFHPTRPGQVLDGRFETITKLGFGSGSTVWLAENLAFKSGREPSIPHYVAIKITTLDVDAAREINIKDDNIMMTIENDDVLESFVKHQRKNPQIRHSRIEDGWTTYLSQGDFGPLKGSQLLPQLSDFNLAFPGPPDGTGHISAAQPHRFRAPEVLLGCPWSYSVDIWNLGLLMWEFMQDVSLFGRPAGEDGEYDAHIHLAQMVSLLGEPDREVIKRERFFRNSQLEKPVFNTHGKECKTMNEFWGGPFFDDNNRIRRTDLIGGKKLADTITELTGDEKDVFLDFASGMLQWLPEKRKTASELLQHPIFDELNESRSKYQATSGATAD